MALTESSVAVSVQKLVDAESERVRTVKAEEQAARARALEQQRRDLDRERARLEQEAIRERAARQRNEAAREAEVLKERLKEQSEEELRQLRQQLEQEYRAKSQASTLQMAVLIGRQRILGALLVTVVAGVGLCWTLVIAPDERRAKVSYASLAELHEGSLNEQRRLEDSFDVERQRLNRQIEALLTRAAANPSGAVSEPRPAIHRPKPSPKPIPPTKPPCNCSYGDPLCDCSR